jgi:hypothetical protein
VSGNAWLANRYVEYFQIIIFLWGFELYSDNYSEYYLNEKISLYLSPFILLISLNTIYMYFAYPNISRTAKKDTAAGLEQMAQGIGGYDFIYFIVFILAGLMYLIFCLDRNFFLKAFLILCITLLSVNIIMSNFMIASLLCLMIIFFRVFIRKTNLKSLSIYFVLVVFLVPILPNFIDYIFDILIKVTEGTMNGQRVLAIRTFIESGILESSLDARWQAFVLSWQAFVSFPLTGIIVTTITNSDGVIVGFGQHSFILDGFALFGVIVGSMSLYVFLYPVFRLNNMSRSIGYSSLPLLILFMVLFLFIFNNVTPSIGAAVFFFIPVIVSYIQRSGQNEIN